MMPVSLPNQMMAGSRGEDLSLQLPQSQQPNLHDINRAGRRDSSSIHHSDALEEDGSEGTGEITTILGHILLTLKLVVSENTKKTYVIKELLAPRCNRLSLCYSVWVMTHEVVWILSAVRLKEGFPGGRVPPSHLSANLSGISFILSTSHCLTVKYNLYQKLTTYQLLDISTTISLARLREINLRQ